MNVTLFGNSLADVIKMKSLGWALIQHDCCPYKKRRRDTEADTQREDSHVKMEAEVGVMLPQTKERRGYLRLEETREDPLLEVSEGALTLPVS